MTFEFPFRDEEPLPMNVASVQRVASIENDGVSVYVVVQFGSELHGAQTSVLLMPDTALRIAAQLIIASVGNADDE